MALPEERKAGLLGYCRIDELTPGEEDLLDALYDAAAGYMTQAGVREPEAGTPRRAQYDLCVNYLVLDSWDRRDVSCVGGRFGGEPRLPAAAEPDEADGTAGTALHLPMAAEVPGWRLVDPGKRTGGTQSRFLRLEG